MATIDNLTEKNVGDLEKMFANNIEPDNPLATLQIHEQQIDHTRHDIQHLSRQVEELKHIIQYIFDGHVLINGKWVAVNKLGK